MKTAAKIFIILGMIVTFWLIVPIIVGIIALQKMEEATSHKDIVGIGVVTLIFCSVLGGIFMLLIPDSEFASADQNQTNSNITEGSVANSYVTSSQKSDWYERLVKLKELYDQGIISEEDFISKKQEILNSK